MIGQVNLIQENKIEKYDDNEAKKRLTIVQRLINEKIYSKENNPFEGEIRMKSIERDKLINEKTNGHVITLTEMKPVREQTFMTKMKIETEEPFPTH